MNLVIDWKLLLLLECDELCTKKKHFDKNDNNYRNKSDDFDFFNFNLNLLLISYDFRVIDFYHCPVCVPNFQVGCYGSSTSYFFSEC